MLHSDERGFLKRDEKKRKMAREGKVECEVGNVSTYNVLKYYKKLSNPFESAKQQNEIVSCAFALAYFEILKYSDSPCALPTVNDNVTAVHIGTAVATEPGYNSTQLIGTAKASTRVLGGPASHRVRLSIKMGSCQPTK